MAAHTSTHDMLFPAASRSWTNGLLTLSWSAGGLVILADLSTVARRTALTGTSALADALIMCPGFHRQQEAPELNRGEYPACAAMTTDYVFRVENQATALYLKNVGRPGQLTCLLVERPASQSSVWSEIFHLDGASRIETYAYISAVMLTLVCLAALTIWKDWCGVSVLVIFILARFINVMVMRRRSKMGWKGELEPGKQSDLIILASQDRWIRMRGAVDDVKAVTSGEWLREPTFLESASVATATLLVYLNAALMANATKEGQILLVALIFVSASLLGLANEYTYALRMYGRTIRIDGRRQVFKRRLHLTKQLIEETGRSNWAIQLGMAQRSDVEAWENEPAKQSSRKMRSSRGSKDDLVIL